MNRISVIDGKQNDVNLEFVQVMAAQGVEPEIWSRPHILIPLLQGETLMVRDRTWVPTVPQVRIAKAKNRGDGIN